MARRVQAFGVVDAAGLSPDVLVTVHGGALAGDDARGQRRVEGGMTPIARYRRTMREDAMQVAIEELVALRQGRVWHVRRSDVAPELVDLPDLLILDPAGNRAVLAELKSQRRSVTAGQAAVLQLAARCERFHSFTVRPEPRDETEMSYDSFLNYLGAG